MSDGFKIGQIVALIANQDMMMKVVGATEMRLQCMTPEGTSIGVGANFVISATEQQKQKFKQRKAAIKQ